MIYRIRHFEKSEFDCKCCGESRISERLVFWLEIIRRVANSALVVSSGYRCKNRNAAVEGSATSRHMNGCAADILTPRNMTYEAFASLARRLSDDGFEVITYPSRTYLHFAIPREAFGRGWNGGSILL